MTRIPDEDIARLKTEISIQRLVESRGIKLKKHGKDLLGLCPFHDDHEPSLVITPSENLWHCLGACNCGGSVIDWVMKAQGVSFKHAVELLKNDIPTTQSQPVKRATTKKLSSPLAADADQQTALNQVINYYHDVLKQSPDALEYLDSRGLNNPELINHFKLGYANRTLAYRLPQKNRKAGADVRQQLQTIGILRDSGHEHFNGSLVVPVTDENNLITEVYGRKVGQRLRKGTPLHTYLPGPHQGVFNIQALKVSKEIILCESLIDAMTFWVNGFRHVTTSYGINGFTDDHLQAFKQHKTERILIAYDNDDAGNKAAKEIKDKLISAGIDVYRINFPKGMDANDYALQVTPATKSLGLVIRKAEWLGRGEAPALTTTESLTSILELETDDEINEDNTRLPLAAMPAPTEASPVPDSASCPEADITDTEINITLDDRHYRIRGLQKNLSYEQLKINLRISVEDYVYVDQLDLYNARQRQAFTKQASVELGQSESTIKTDLGKVLLKLESLQEQQIKKQLDTEEKPDPLSPDAYNEALSLLKDKHLLQRILADFNACGVVGEETNKLVGYLACVSRKLNKPLAVMIQSSSAAGKSALMDAILNFIPEHQRIQYSAMTGQSLYYMGDMDLKHKILAISEEEGAENASYALKLLQSEGEVSIASTGKDETTGNMVTKSYKVEGPVMLFLTTTAIDIDEELLNRCLVLTVNESAEQTSAIHEIQRQQQTLQGLLADNNKTYLTELHRNAQTLLQPLNVVNPYAEQLTFLSDKTRTRRDHMKYLQLINSITLLHQYQREIKTVEHRGEQLKYIEVTLKDIDTANNLAHEVLGRTLDELPPQTRKLLSLIYKMVTKACQTEKIKQNNFLFSRKSVREFTGWGDTQLKIHLSRLAEMEYLSIYRQGQAFKYELLYQGEDKGKPVLCGLIDTTLLKKQHYDNNQSGQTIKRSGSGRPSVGAQSGPGRIDEKPANATHTEQNAVMTQTRPENVLRENKHTASYRSHILSTEG
nr:CHC2 zinc finger domain-containing protein [Pseudodesulfovibrio sp.]